MRYNPAKGHFGFLSEALFQQFIDNYLIVEHLWVAHILRKENPVQSKFLLVYACVKELHNLFVSCICLAIEKNSVVVTHDKNAKVITYYEVEYDYAIGSFEHPTEGTLYQCQLVVTSKKGHFATDSPSETGSKLKSSQNKVELEETVVETELMSSLSNLGSTRAGISIKDSQDKKRRKEDDPQEKTDEKPNSKIHKQVRKVTKSNCKSNKM